VIISEFRIPTMAAKKIVDRLRDAGRDIPVLVTTSQSGKTADLLVEKLGASGYLSKPLSAAQVVPWRAFWAPRDIESRRASPCGCV
jgi:CheY-like chemotaxis protein